MNIWLKPFLSTLSQRLSCFKASIPDTMQEVVVVAVVGVGAKRSLLLPDCRPLSSPLLCSSSSPRSHFLLPSIYPSLFFHSRSLFLDRYHSAEKHLSCPAPLIACATRLSVFFRISPWLPASFSSFFEVRKRLCVPSPFLSVIKVRYSESVRLSRSFVYWAQRKQKSR